MRGRLLHCLECGEIVWSAPIEHYAIPQVDEEPLQDDTETFTERHQGHIIEYLTPLTHPLSDRPYAEPLRVSYFWASNGARRYLIKRWRTDINVPWEYELVDGWLEVTQGTLQPQTEAITKQFKIEFDSTISACKLDAFVQAIYDEVHNLDPHSLPVAAEGETSLVTYYLWDCASLERLLKRCARIFTSYELELLSDFVRRHNTHDGVMTLVAQRSFCVRHGAHEELLEDWLRLNPLPPFAHP